MRMMAHKLKKNPGRYLHFAKWVASYTGDKNPDYILPLVLLFIMSLSTKIIGCPCGHKLRRDLDPCLHFQSGLLVTELTSRLDHAIDPTFYSILVH